MAEPPNRAPQIAPGRFHVSADCTHCGGCLIHAPRHFAGGDSEWKTHAYVARQPVTPKEIADCLAALADCPCEAIHDNEAETP